MKRKFENYKIKPELTCSIIVVCLIFLIEFILACINKSWYTSVNLIIPLSKTIFRYCLNFTSIIIIIKSSKFTFLHSSLQSLFIFTLWFRPQRDTSRTHVKHTFSDTCLNNYRFFFHKFIFPNNIMQRYKLYK